MTKDSKDQVQPTPLPLQEFSGLALSQWRILVLVGLAGESRSADIAREAALDKGLLGRNLKRLVADGMVSARIAPKDQRAKFLTLKPKGKTIFDNSLPKMRARQHALRSALTDEGLNVLMTARDKLEVAASWRGADLEKRPPTFL